MTYALLSIAFLPVAVLIAVLGWRHAPHGHARALLVTAIALVALTAVFDTIMIATGLFGYADAHIWGVRVGLAPIEDFAYPLAGVLLLTGLWNLLAPAERDHAD